MARSFLTAAVVAWCPVGTAASESIEVPDWVESRADRAEVKEKYGALFQEVSAVLFSHDPIGINFETNTDEYDAEAGTIIPRLKECRSEADAHRVVLEEFKRWCGDVTVGKSETYLKPSQEIWQVWLRFKEKEAL
jgi:hypothetical protein